MTTYWWLRPSRIALFVVIPIQVLAYLADDRTYANFGAHNAITSDDFLVIWVSMLGYAGAAWVTEMLGAEQRRQSAPVIDSSVFVCLSWGLALIATIGTLIFLLPFMRNPTLVLNIVTGRPGAAELARLYAESIPGITSLENLFNLTIVLLMVKPLLTGRSITAAEKLLLAFILALTTVKVVINSERLALIELLVPMGVLACSLRRRSALIALAPFAAVTVLCVFFTGTEYLRSWVTYYSAKSNSVWDFAIQRMFGYYITAINNGAFIYNNRHDYLFPVFTAGWLWRLPMPGLAAGLSEILNTPSPDPTDLKAMLYGLNVEFNNTSGIFAPLTDFGAVLGAAVWTALGLLSGWLYRCFRQARPIGLILYPTWFVGVLEIPREFYWGDNRYFPTLVVSLAIAAFLLLSQPQIRRRSIRPVALVGILTVVLVLPARAADAISIAAFGADSTGQADSTAAINAAIRAAKLRGAIALVPQGVYRHRSFQLDGVSMVGTGTRSVLLATQPNDATIVLRGEAPALRNVAVTVQSSRRDSLHAAVLIDAARHFAVEAVTINGGNAGGIMNYGGGYGRIVGNTISDTLADAIHNTHGAHDVLIADNTVRNSGDDMIAVVSYESEPGSRDIRIQHNDLADLSYGRGISVVGGRGVLIADNRVAATRCCAGIYIASEAAWKTQGAADIVVRDNVLIENSGPTGHGAITVFSDRAPITHVRIEGNSITDSRHAAVQLSGRVTAVSIIGNHIMNAAGGNLDRSKEWPTER